MNIDFGHSPNDSIYVNPSITILSISPLINSLKSGSGIEFRRNRGDGIPARNIRSFSLFGRWTSGFSKRNGAGCGTTKSESENLGDNIIFENTEREEFIEVENLGSKVL